MDCKRCKSPLPSQGYVCKQCGMLMSSEQIELQKTFMKENNMHLKAELISEKYGGKKQIFEMREKDENNLIFFTFFFGVLLIIFIIVIVVYFL